MEEPGSSPIEEVGPSADGVVARPSLFERLGSSARVTVVSAPAGSGKTVLLRSWLREADLIGHAAWVRAGPDLRDPQRFWLSALAALRRTDPGSGLVQPVSAAPGQDGWALVERLLSDLAALEEPLWLVIDNADELSSNEVLRQLELLVMRAPLRLKFVLATRHDLRLGLHRLRLEGKLTEIRATDLRFSLEEAGELLGKAGVELPGAALSTLHERTEGWAAGLRLAALSLAGHPDPEGFAAGFAGSERTVAEYLLAEVLERQSDAVRRLLLRTSVLERVNGDLAALLTGDDGAEAVLQDLEAANAFTVALDPARTWYRYHQMFAGLLQLELRRTAPGEVAGLHRAAAGWFIEHGHSLDAIRHAQAARDWGLASRLLADHWPALYLDGHATTANGLLAGFPTDLLTTDAELAVLAAADELARGSLEAAERSLGLAERRSASVPEARRAQAQVLLGVVRLLLARQRGNLPVVLDQARRLAALAEAAEVAQRGLGQDLYALALISVGSTQFWAAQPEEAAAQLERGIALARRIGRPYLEFTGLAHLAAAEFNRSFARAVEDGRLAMELAERHGWTDDPAAGVACMALGTVLTRQGRLDEAEPWVLRAERTFTAEAQPAAGMAIRHVRGALELARGRTVEAVATLEAAQLLARRLAGPHYLLPRTRAQLLEALVHLGETERAERILTGLGREDREQGEIRIATAALSLAQGDPQAATAALAPVLDGPAPPNWRTWMAQAYLLEAKARDALGDPVAAQRALEGALDMAEPDGDLLAFLLFPAAGLLERHARRGTAHASLVAEIQSLLAGAGPRSRPSLPQALREPLSESELRVLRYLPTNLSTTEIAHELYVSPNTVKTHIRNLYAKLGSHRRGEAVESARGLGLLAPTARRPTVVAEPSTS